MAYIVTPDLGLELADPSTVQPFETPNVNSNFLTLEAGVVADRVRLSAIEGNLKRVADLDALAALSTAGVGAGSIVEVGELRALFMRNFANTAWEQITAARFATTAARDTAYAKAAGAYQKQGARATTDDVGFEWTYYELFNAGTNKFGATTAGWYPSPGQQIQAAFTVSSLSLPNNSETTIGGGGAGGAWTEEFDPWGWHDAVTTPSRITMAFPGRYRATLNSAWGGNSAGSRLTRIRPNNGSNAVPTGAAALDTVPGASGGGQGSVASTGIVSAAGATYLDVSAYQNSGGALAVSLRLVVSYEGPLLGL